MVYDKYHQISLVLFCNSIFINPDNFLFGGFVVLQSSNSSSTFLSLAPGFSARLVAFPGRPVGGFGQSLATAEFSTSLSNGRMMSTSEPAHTITFTTGVFSAWAVAQKRLVFFTWLYEDRMGTIALSGLVCCLRHRQPGGV